jgi:small subunit ribosomal protein S9
MRTTFVAALAAAACVMFVVVGHNNRRDIASPLMVNRVRAPVMAPMRSMRRDVSVNSAVADAPVRREAIATAKGGRKRAHAKCAVFPGSGKIVINDKDSTEYFKNNVEAYMELYQLLYLIGLHTENDVYFKVEGGGTTGQKDAIKLAAARLLIDEDFPLSPTLPREQLKAMFKEKGWLTRDAREKERKKYGLKKARKAPQFSKR